MKASVRVLSLIGLLVDATFINAFTPAHHHRVLSRTSTPTSLLSSTQEDGATATATKPKTQELGLLTFDLDDTLYPIEPVVKAANGKTRLNWYDWTMMLGLMPNISHFLMCRCICGSNGEIWISWTFRVWYCQYRKASSGGDCCYRPWESSWVVSIAVLFVIYFSIYG